ncbi:MAG: alpha/beta fold hydrolase [Alphaproteobacteria bacterium]|nr:alpha/beta fold hydrolase [Alphaproteobacteria bacterium]
MRRARPGLSWETDGLDWPNRETSRFVQASGLRWHVQVTGTGPVVLLIHGTGGATHSWRDVLPLLAARFTVIAPDLPGHGFTQKPPGHRLSMTGMSRAIADLLIELDLAPDLAVGHSAGAAILVRMCLSEQIAPKALVSFNGAFLPLGGVAGQVFAPIAKVLSLNPLVPSLFAWRAGDPRLISRLLQDTGSSIDPEGVAFYGRLARDPGHAAGALGMMANWDLKSLERDLPKLQVPLALVAAERDRAIALRYAKQVAEMVPNAQLRAWPALGHLAHEEDPQGAADMIVETAEQFGVGRAPA